MSNLPPASNRPVVGTYDYIVVGAGSAGCAVAGRLAADPNCNVLLLEAGHAGTHPLVRIPGGVRFTIGSPRHDWMLKSEPDPSTDGRRHAWPRGKMLGGCSGINGMIYARGAAADYDEMARRGMAGWAWADVAPFFRLSEDFESGASAQHGAGGPMKVSHLRTPHFLSTKFLDACAETGVEVLSDINGGMDTGMGFVHATQRNGARWTAADGYLRQGRRKANLKVITRAHAERLLFEGSRAVGVYFRQGEQPVQARARREIIVCAGSIYSPHLLMHSGIGDPAALQAQGIEVRCARPAVGRNLHDHCDVGLKYEVNMATFNMKIDLFSMARYGMRWLLRRDGPVASPGAQAYGLYRSRPGLARPDIGMYFQPNGYRLEPGKIVFNREPTVTLFVMTTDPRSRGELQIASPDPLQPPRIHSNLLSDAADQAAILWAMRHGRRIMLADALKPYIVRELGPGQQVIDDQGMLAYARSIADPVQHTSGTCRMGVDDEAVVDSQLRVRGVQGLRVADMSVVATVPGANTNATAIMIGERCADFIIRGTSAAPCADPRPVTTRERSALAQTPSP